MMGFTAKEGELSSTTNFINLRGTLLVGIGSVKENLEEKWTMLVDFAGFDLVILG